jgi:hypothetical protein
MNDYKEMLDSIMRDPRYQRNLDWGKARSGHPEGKVRAHIAELERNLEALRHKLAETDYWRLRVLIHTHDTFKAEAQPGAPITSPNSHASLARVFLADFCDDRICWPLCSITTSHSPFGASLRAAARSTTNA